MESESLYVRCVCAYTLTCWCVSVRLKWHWNCTAVKNIFCYLIDYLFNSIVCYCFAQYSFILSDHNEFIHHHIFQWWIFTNIFFVNFGFEGNKPIETERHIMIVAILWLLYNEYYHMGAKLKERGVCHGVTIWNLKLDPISFFK